MPLVLGVFAVAVAVAVAMAVSATVTAVAAVAGSECIRDNLDNSCLVFWRHPPCVCNIRLFDRLEAFCNWICELWVAFWVFHGIVALELVALCSGSGSCSYSC